MANNIILVKSDFIILRRFTYAYRNNRYTTLFSH